MAEISDLVVDDEKKNSSLEWPLRLTKPSKAELENLKLKYGWVKLEKIKNESSNNVHFVNPFWPSDTDSGCAEGDIAPGESNELLANGFMPYYSSPKKYEVTYYNTTLEKECVIYICDLGGSWLVSFSQVEAGVSIEHTTDITPGFHLYYSTFELIIHNNGCDILQTGAVPVFMGGLYFW